MAGRYRDLEVRCVVGRGPAAFEALRSALITWRVHAAAGVAALGAESPVTRDDEVMLRLRFGPATLGGRVRVRDVEHGPRRAAFSYESLPGHPEEGWSEFSVQLDDADLVIFTVRSRSRAGRWWSRLGGPASRRVQQRITGRYVESARRIAAPTG